MRPRIHHARAACEAAGARQAVVAWFDDCGRFAVAIYGATRAEYAAVRPLCDAIADAFRSGALPTPVARRAYVVTLRAAGRRGEYVVATSEPLAKDFHAKDFYSINSPTRAGARALDLSIDDERTHDFGTGGVVERSSNLSPLWPYGVDPAHRGDLLLIPKGSVVSARIAFDQECE